MAGRRARVRRLSSGSFHFAGIAALFGLLISSILYENCLADVSPDLGRALSSAVLTPTHLFFLFGKRGDYNSGPAYQKYFNDTLAIDLNRPKGGINSVSIFRDNSTNSNQTSSQLIPRASTSCAFDSESQRIYCVGGENNDTSLIPNPLFSLSVASGAFGGWTENPTTAPPRDASGSAVLGNVNINGSTSAGRQLVTFGGRYQAVNKVGQFPFIARS